MSLIITKQQIKASEESITDYYPISMFQNEKAILKKKTLAFPSGHPKGHLLLQLTKTHDSIPMGSWEHGWCYGG